MTERRLYEVFEELEKLRGRRVKEARVGECGFDLVFDDGTCLEVYCLGEWGVVVDKEEADDRDSREDDKET